MAIPRRWLNALIITGLLLFHSNELTVEGKSSAIPAGESAAAADWSRLLVTIKNGEQWDLYSAAPDLSGRVLIKAGLTDESSARVDPLSTSVVYSLLNDGYYNLYQLSLDDTTTVQTLTPNDANKDNFDWSPDGSILVFEKENFSAYGLYRLSQSGEESKLIDANLYNESQPDWSPDGQKIAYISNKEGSDSVWTINPDGSQAVSLQTNHSSQFPAWSPDGAQIAYTNNEDYDDFQELCVVQTDGSLPTVLYDPSGTGNAVTVGVLRPVWSPDGSRLAFTQVTRSGVDYFTYRYRAAVYDFSTQQVTLLSSADEDVKVLDWYTGDSSDVWTTLSVPAYASVEEPFTVIVNYGNSGKMDAGEATMGLTLPEGVSLVSSSVPAVGTNPLSWTLGSLEASSAAGWITLSVAASAGTAESALAFTAEIQSSPADLDLSNNTATGTVWVESGPVEYTNVYLPLSLR